MKLKYFLRGLGVGIIFGALIMLVAYLTSGAGKLSDKEIIERAENLGMVQADNMVIIGTEKDDADASSEAETITTDAEQTEEMTTEQGTSDDIIQDSDVSIESVLDGSINPTTEGETTDATTEEANANYVTAKISVTSGMTSSEVALLLQNAGIIQDYLDFDQYLNDNGYSTQIRINDYEFNSDMSYQEIAEALIKEDKIEE